MTPRRPGRTQARDLERYASLFADRTTVMKSSPMRDLMALTARPEVISLAGGLPDTSTFPAEDFAKLMSHLGARETARALQYGPTEGVTEIKRAIVQVMAAEGTEVDEDDILPTTGGQQVIDLVCKTLVDPGDVIIAEAPTYPGAVPTFAAYQAEVIQIEMDSDGMRIDVLEETLERLDREGRRPKFIYTIPNFQNPAGVTMSLPRRRRLVDIAHERELLVLEDNPYGLLRYEGEPIPSLYSMDGGEFVIYLGTFSKILSPGVRVGWSAAPRPVLQKMNIGKASTDLCSSPLNQLFVAEYFASGQWPVYMDELRALYHRRRDVLLDALAKNLPAEASWTRPDGGLFIWATLPDGLDTTDLLAKALSRNVAFVPGRAAFMDGRGGTSMRLNFSGVSDERIVEGVRRIGEVVHEQVDLLGSLTGRRPGAVPRPAQPAAEPAGQRPADPALENVLQLPRRDGDDAATRRSSS
ncbi:2-aminoadipate transaminase [Paraconexibacter sp. AEG42_29]|uniref:2-aminoadipate transaminase n=1 Tax=Paraconexibacter sp. AEG42_29 TaxID=2997339 RepID=A0AAU7B3R4_9ACTN